MSPTPKEHQLGTLVSLGTFFVLLMSSLGFLAFQPLKDYVARLDTALQEVADRQGQASISAARLNENVARIDQIISRQSDLIERGFEMQQEAESELKQSLSDHVALPAHPNAMEILSDLQQLFRNLNADFQAHVKDGHPESTVDKVESLRDLVELYHQHP